MRAKRTEAMTNVEAIGKMERAYFGENGIYPDATAAPAGLARLEAELAGGGALLLRRPRLSAEGSVWFVYDVNSARRLCLSERRLLHGAAAYGDSDLDGTFAVIATFHADGGGVVCPCRWCPRSMLRRSTRATGVAVLDQVVDIFTYDSLFGTIPQRADDF